MCENNSLCDVFKYLVGDSKKILEGIDARNLDCRIVEGEFRDIDSLIEREVEKFDFYGYNDGDVVQESYNVKIQITLTSQSKINIDIMRWKKASAFGTPGCCRRTVRDEYVGIKTKLINCSYCERKYVQRFDSFYSFVREGITFLCDRCNYCSCGNKFYKHRGMCSEYIEFYMWFRKNFNKDLATHICKMVADAWM